MEWLAQDIERGQMVLGFVALAIAAAVIWFGRKNLFLSILIAFGVLILAAMVIPSAIPARFVAQQNACIQNLQMIQEAKTAWEQTHESSADDNLTKIALVDTDSDLRDWPKCPGGGTYTIGAANQNPTCSLAAKGHRLE